MKVWTLAGKFVQTLREDGLRTIFRKALVRIKPPLAQDSFDLRHGTDTGGLEPLWKFHIRSPNKSLGFCYQPTEEQELVDAVNFLHEDLQAFTFVDLGCGKGRALLVASNLGFEQLIGVEFARELAGIAKANLEKMRIANASVIQSDAADFHFPDIDTVVFLNNPFGREVMRKVVANLRTIRAGRLYVIYRVPMCPDAFDGSDFLGRFGSLPGKSHVLIWRKVERSG